MATDVSMSRTFGGRRYVLGTTENSKPDANKRARLIRSQGKSARVVRFIHAPKSAPRRRKARYAIYVRQ